MANLYSIRMEPNGWYQVLENGTWNTVAGHLTYREALRKAHELTAAAVQRPRPELDDLVRADEEAVGPNN